MSNRSIFWAGLMGAVATIPLIQMAATAPEINKIAESITVQILEPNSQGSGVILQHQGDVYTVLTAAHVVRNKNVAYTIATPDGKKHQIISDSIRRPSVDIDLAVVKFRASANYPTAKLGNCNVLKGGMDLYVAGYPIATKTITDSSIFVFREGKVSANSNKTFEKGYSLIYSNDTLPGMSVGAVLNQNGELVAIHGRADKEINSSGDKGAKTGFNLGILINRFATIAANLGVNLDGKVAVIPQTAIPKADDYFVLASQKYVKGDYRGALADYNRAIQLNPNDAYAYIGHGALKVTELNDTQGALADYNRAIQLNPNDAYAYTNRAIISYDLGNTIAAANDWKKAISLDPRLAEPYMGLAVLTDKQGDYSKASTLRTKALELDRRYGDLQYLKQEANWSDKILKDAATFFK